MFIFYHLFPDSLFVIGPDLVIECLTELHGPLHCLFFYFGQVPVLLVLLLLLLGLGKNRVHLLETVVVLT